jgi:kinesin family protein 2/24
MLDPEHGLYVLAAQDIFRLLSSDAYSHLSASVGFYEIYQGQLFDLLNQKSKLTAREDGMGNVVIAGLREYGITNVQDMMSVFEYGNQGRTTGETGANNKSSRSHAVLQIMLRKEDSKKVHGKLSFIDLAGSERGADRGDADTKTR